MGPARKVTSMSRGTDDEDRETRKAQMFVRSLEWFDREVGLYEAEGITITGFSVRLPKFEGDDYFLVVRATADGEKMVAFRDGEDLVGLLRGLLRAVKAQTLKFREDKYD